VVLGQAISRLEIPTARVTGLRGRSCPSRLLLGVQCTAQRSLPHRHITTTEIYARVGDEALLAGCLPWLLICLVLSLTLRCLFW